MKNGAVQIDVRQADFAFGFAAAFDYWHDDRRKQVGCRRDVVNGANVAPLLTGAWIVEIVGHDAQSEWRDESKTADSLVGTTF